MRDKLGRYCGHSAVIQHMYIMAQISESKFEQLLLSCMGITVSPGPMTSSEKGSFLNTAIPTRHFGPILHHKKPNVFQPVTTSMASAYPQIVFSHNKYPSQLLVNFFPALAVWLPRIVSGRKSNSRETQEACEPVENILILVTSYVSNKHKVNSKSD